MRTGGGVEEDVPAVARVCKLRTGGDVEEDVNDVAFACKLRTGGCFEEDAKNCPDPTAGETKVKRELKITSS